MATSSNFCLMVACFMISSALMIKTGLSYVVLEPSSGPSSEVGHASGPLPPYENYLNNCAMKLYPSCGDEIFSAIFVGNQIVSRACCDKLVNDVGKLCHDDMTKFILELPKFKAAETQILQRSQKVWNDCVLLDYPSIELIGIES